MSEKTYPMSSATLAFTRIDEATRAGIFDQSQADLFRELMSSIVADFVIDQASGTKKEDE